MQATRSALFLVVGLVAFSACDVFGSDPGAFEVSVAGGEVASFSGEPATILNPAGTADPSEQRFQFRLAAPGNDEIVSVTAATDGRPELAEGEYPIGRFGVDLRAGRAEATVSLKGNQAFLSLSGTLTLTEVTDDSVRGSFEFEAVEGGESNKEVTVRGSFRADLGRNAIS